jgi:hypothetical protein
MREDNTASATLNDTWQLESWRAYHRGHATLRVMSRDAYEELTTYLNRQQQQQISANTRACMAAY